MYHTVLFTTNLSFQYIYVRDEFNNFLDFFVQAFKIIVDPWKFSILLLYI